MRGWLAANAFFMGMALTMACFAYLILSTVPRLGFSPSIERGTAGVLLILAMVLTGYIWRAILRKLET